MALIVDTRDQLLALRSTAVLPQERPSGKRGQCSIVVFTETWPNPMIPDSHVTQDGFNLCWTDRTKDSGERKGGGLAVFIKDRWCNSGHTC